MRERIYLKVKDRISQLISQNLMINQDHLRDLLICFLASSTSIINSWMLDCKVLLVRAEIDFLQKEIL